MIERKHVEWIASVVMFIIIAVVFHQIYTVMEEAGIAQGGPYQNAASYPHGVAVLIGILLVIQNVVRLVTPDSAERDRQGLRVRDLVRPTGLLLVFTGYLGLFPVLGYYISTIPFLVCVMAISGDRKWLRMILVSVVVTVFLAFVFEVLLRIVLPGGIFRFNMQW